MKYFLGSLLQHSFGHSLKEYQPLKIYVRKDRVDFSCDEVFVVDDDGKIVSVKSEVLLNDLMKALEKKGVADSISSVEDLCKVYENWNSDKSYGLLLPYAYVKYKAGQHSFLFQQSIMYTYPRGVVRILDNIYVVKDYRVLLSHLFLNDDNNIVIRLDVGFKLADIVVDVEEGKVSFTEDNDFIKNIYDVMPDDKALIDNLSNIPAEYLSELNKLTNNRIYKLLI